MPFDSRRIHQVARLARLHLTAEEEATLGEQLGRIVEYIDRLRAFEGEAVAQKPLGPDACRSDLPAPYPGREGLLELAPDRKLDFFVVPRVIATSDG